MNHLTKDTAQQLAVENSNNILGCDGFVQVHFAPPVAGLNKEGIFIAPITEESFNKIYVIKRGEESVFVRLDSFVRLKFWQISSIYTIPGYGIESHLWKQKFKERYAEVSDDTDMAVYCYLRLK